MLAFQLFHHRFIVKIRNNRIPLKFSINIFIENKEAARSETEWNIEGTTCRGEDAGVGGWKSFPGFLSFFFFFLCSKDAWERVSRLGKPTASRCIFLQPRFSYHSPLPPPTSCRSFDHNYLKTREVLQNCRVLTTLTSRVCQPKLGKTRNFCRLGTPF